jgi:hypothetical protein
MDSVTPTGQFHAAADLFSSGRLVLETASSRQDRERADSTDQIASAAAPAAET